VFVSNAVVFFWLGSLVLVNLYTYYSSSVLASNRPLLKLSFMLCQWDSW